MSYYVYKHYNKDLEIIYVGLTTNINSRQADHKSSSVWKNEIYKIEYAEVSDSMLMNIYEKYYIDKYLPKYNKKDINCKYSRFFISLDELKFKEYKVEKYIVKRNRNPKKSNEEIFEEYYLNSLKVLSDFKEEFLVSGEVYGDYIKLNKYINVEFCINFHKNGSNSMTLISSLNTTEAKYLYFNKYMDINMDCYIHLKSDKQRNYKSLDKIWEEVFK